MTDLLNFDSAPADPIERLLWLSGVQSAVDQALDAEFSQCYFTARLQGEMDRAVGLRLHSKKRILAWTRNVNNRRGRPVRWNDGLDPYHSG